MRRRRRKRAKFDRGVLVTLDKAFGANPRPSSEELDCISQTLGYEKEVVRIWFCNKRAKIQRGLKRTLMDRQRYEEVLESVTICRFASANRIRHEG